MHQFLDRSYGFIGSSNNYEEADFALFGIPMDFTVSFQPGTRWGAQAVRAVSKGIEEYSFYQKRSLAEVKYFDCGDIVLPYGNVHESLKRIEGVAGQLLDDSKFPVAIGGEHLVTLPLVKVVYQKYPDLVVFQFDAHADLREDYFGERQSHATVLRQVSEIVSPANIYQFGIRSGTQEEYEFGTNKTHMFIDEVLEPLKKVVEDWDNRPVYVTLDIDVVDPAYAPGTGTPEPGGCSSKEIIQAINYLKQLPVVAFDLVEVAPSLDPSQRTAILAAKLVREALLVFRNPLENPKKTY